MRVAQSLVAVSLLVQVASSFSGSWQPKHPKYPKRLHNPYLGKRDGNTTLTGYDYVVVGSGPGGGPTAANLAIAGFKVLLIDAGGDQGDELVEVVPALNLASTEFASTEWDFYVNHHADLEQQKRDSKMVYELADGTQYIGLDPPEDATPVGILYPRSGTLGGCSRHNALVTIQAFDSDWNGIAELTGDDTWQADKMRKYFEKIEKNNYLPSSIVGHGYTGWLDTSLTSLVTAISDLKLVSLILACTTAMGQTILGELLTTVTDFARVLLEDINAPGQLLHEGVYQVPLSMRDSKRGGARDFIIDTAEAVNADGSRKYYLDIKLNTLVTKVLFNETGDVPVATGVEFWEGESLYRADKRSANVSGPSAYGTVTVSREVIVAGGTFNTPQILKLSGVGPKDELESFGIPVVVDLPGVGLNLQDRTEQTIFGTTNSNFSLIDGCTFKTTDDDPCLVKWKTGATQTDKGVYASNGLALAVILKTSSADTEDPDVIVTAGPAQFKGYYPGWSDVALEDHVHWSWIVLKGHTRNTAGNVTLRSTDPRDTPIINFNTFTIGADKDLQAVYEGIEFSRKAFASVIPLDGSFTEVWPGQNVSTQAEIEQYVRDESWGHHASCTAPIGADDDPNAVLDTNLNVRGTKNLRVVDASSFPKIPGFFVALPLYMLAEKASEAIIQAANES